MRKEALILLTVLIALFSASATQATLILVPSEQPTIQAGVNAASAGDTVLLAAGTYSGDGNWNIDIATAGIVIGSEDGAAATVIDCQGQGPAITVSAMGDTSTVIYGLTFTGGVGNYEHPGAVYLLRPAALRDCVFSGNQGQNGGALKLWNGGIFVVDGCVFSDNSVTSRGGAIHNNSCLLILRNSVFTGNESAADGGAIYLQGGALRMSGCTLVSNSGSPSGAIACKNMTTQEVAIDRSIVAFSTLGCGVDQEYPGTEVMHSFVFANAGGDSLPEGSHDNAFEDPRLCGIDAGDVSLCSDSPCLPSSPGNPWGVQAGALGQGCDACGSAVVPASWGAIKAFFNPEK